MAICKHALLTHPATAADLLFSRPHDGRNISFMQAVRTLNAVYGISTPLAMILAVGGMLLCGKWYRLPWQFDLYELAKHNRIEHDFSLAHDDADPQSPNADAPVRVSHTLIKRLLEVTHENYFTMADFVTARMRRTQYGIGKPLDSLHKEIAHGEAALTLCVFGVPPPKSHVDETENQNVVPRSYIEQWYGHDRLPDGWKKPTHIIGFRETVGMSKKINMELLRRFDFMRKCA